MIEYLQIATKLEPQGGSSASSKRTKRCKARSSSQIGDVEAAIGMNTIQFVQLLGQCFVEFQELRKHSRLAIDPQVYFVQEVGSKAATSP